MCEDAFREYFSEVVVKRFKYDKEYREIQAKIDELCAQYPTLLAVFDSDQPGALTKQECEALIEINGLKSQVTNMELEAVYLRGCHDGILYLQKAGLV